MDVKVEVSGDVGVKVGVNVDVNVEVIAVVIVGVDVNISVGVADERSVRVGEAGMLIIFGVSDGINGGVGERIAGRGEGHEIGDATTSGI